MNKIFKEARSYLDDFGPGYDAHRDGLTDIWEHKESVNKLLKHLRAVLNEAEKPVKKAKKK